MRETRGFKKNCILPQINQANRKISITTAILVNGLNLNPKKPSLLSRIPLINDTMLTEILITSVSNPNEPAT